MPIKNKRSFTKTVQREFNKMIANGKPCVKCGQTFKVMQCSHIRSVGAYPCLRFDVMNVFPMCGRHHNFWWHDEPGDAWPWFEKNYPGRDEYLLKAKNKLVHYTLDDLKVVRQHIKNKEIRKLIIAPELLDKQPK